MSELGDYMRRSLLLSLIVSSLLTQTGCDVGQVGQMMVQAAGMMQQMRNPQNNTPAVANVPATPAVQPAQAAGQAPANQNVQTNPAREIAVKQEGTDDKKPKPEDTALVAGILK